VNEPIAHPKENLRTAWMASVPATGEAVEPIEDRCWNVSPSEKQPRDRARVHATQHIRLDPAVTLEYRPPVRLQADR
jgi:hypothetical protein